MIIQHAKDCPVKIYVKAMFDEDLSVLATDEQPVTAELEHALQTIHEEFLDVSGMQRSESVGLAKRVEMLETRLKLVNIYVKLHRDCLTLVGEPFHPAIEKLVEFGYRLKWEKENPDAFKKQLDFIQRKEKRYDAELKIALKNYEKIKDKAAPEESKNKARIKFLSNINNLNRFGFSIDKEKTTMEELGLMIKDYDEHIRLQKIKNRK